MKRVNKSLAISGFVAIAALLCVAAWWLPSLRPQPADVGKAAPPLSAEEFGRQVAVMSGMQSEQSYDNSANMFTYVREQSALNSSFARDCHPMLHAVGRAAFVWYGGFAGAMEHQSELCNSGYTHGIIEAHFINSLAQADDKAEGIQLAMSTACPTPQGDSLTYQQWQCFHGAGHGLMLAHSRNVAPSLASCRTLAPEAASNTCSNGVFMEHFNLTDHTGHQRTAGLGTGGNSDSANLPELKLSQGTLPACSLPDLNDSERKSCYMYAPAAYMDSRMESHGGEGGFQPAYQWCRQLRSELASICVNGLGIEAMEKYITEPAAAAALCRSFARGHQAVCSKGAVSLYINHKASSAAAAPLCGNEFKDFRAVCESVVQYKRDNLSI